MWFKKEEYKFIKEYFDKYNEINVKPLKFPSDNAKIIFKNLNDYDFNNNHLSVENYVIEYYKHQGYNAFFAENRYWLLLFLIIYFKQSVMGVRLLVELDFATNTHSDNYIHRIKKMDFNYIKDIPNLKEYLVETYFKCLNYNDDGYDIFKNGNLDYNLFSIDQIVYPISHLDIEQLILIFKRMGEDFEYYTSGLPDLIVYNETEFFFVEVKSKKDKPSFKQIQWHKYLVDVVNIDVVIFNINKTDVQIDKIKKKYDTELSDSNERSEFKGQRIGWDNFELNQKYIQDDEITERMKRRYFFGILKNPCGEYTRITKDIFEDIDQWHEYYWGVLKRNADFIYERAIEVYSTDNLGDCNPTKIQLSRNKEAKLLENKGDYKGAISLYINNVNERTGSPTTYKRLINIYKKFGKLQELVKLMDMAIPIFIKLNDKNNVLYFIFIKFAARSNRGKLTGREEIILKKIKEDEKKSKTTIEKDIQTDLSNYF